MGEEIQNSRFNIQKNIEKIQWIIESSNWDEANEKLQKVYWNWLQKVFVKIQDREYETARQEFFSIYTKNESCQNTESAIMGFWFKVHAKEIANGEESTLQQFSSIEQMVFVYNELKFLVRRFEYDLSQELKEGLYVFLQQFLISAYAIGEMIERYITQKEKVFNQIAIFLFQKKCYEYILPLLFTAYERNAGNKNTVYNMAYCLYAFGEKQTALQILERAETSCEQMRELQQIIQMDGTLPELKETALKNEHSFPLLEKPEEQEKIAFIICVNDERQYEECSLYIHHLYVPDGYSVEIIPVYDAESMTGGYQKGMKMTSAKYKIYMHQDVLCINPNMLYELLHIFQCDSKIGMVGVAGCIKMPDVGVWWQANTGIYYNLIQDNIIDYVDNLNEFQNKYNCGEYQEVEALDGVFLATAKDVNWREDLFNGWHHYDVSQCMEFQRKGYKVVIPRPKEEWVLHNEKWKRMLKNDYWQADKCFLQEYEDELVAQ